MHALSALVGADRRQRDAVYQAHRWFARRPPALLRALLLAATVDNKTADDQFWQQYASNGPALDGLTVLDPFIGGGTTLVEAGRLGANVIGCDIDPVAVRLVQHELQPPVRHDVSDAAIALLDHLHETCGPLYPSQGDSLPLHTFSLATVTCPECQAKGELYRSPVLARGVQKPGSVARPQGTTVFCPACFALAHLKLDAKVLDHCGHRFRLDHGTYSGYHYTCPNCRRRATHSDLRTGAQPRRLIAVEQTHGDGPRTFRLPTPEENQLDATADEYLRSHDLRLPSGKVPPDNKGGRPGSLGLETFPDLFTPRQLALFGTAFSWIDSHPLELAVSRALTLGVSNALATNNRLCGYATDYGRLAALFSVRGYSLPALAVELNALHPTAGRGTLPRTLDRVTDSLTATTRRTHFPATKTPGSAATQSRSKFGSDPSTAIRGMAVSHRRPPHAVVLLGAAPDVMAGLAAPSDLSPSIAEGSTAAGSPASGRALTLSTSPVVDVVVTDPPYYDYIAYDTLSAFYRAWSEEDHLHGEPVLPAGADPVRTFASGLAAVLTAAQTHLRQDGIVALTYHSLNPDAWQALSQALQGADLRVTALWPVLSDPHMGHHGTSGAIQYDLVIVARAAATTLPATPPKPYPSAWLSWLGLTTLGEADRNACTLAFTHLRPLWGRPKWVTSSPAAPQRLVKPTTASAIAADATARQGRGSHR